ncbi:AMP-dependent synthetase/ligase [Marinitenerispora sediminis]|uniref:AMP-dependent synthetase/ligase n=1 Tax=Marinitenerispora sediminis TaxID=1931232 RepID=UPI000DF420A4|nr:long-chain fatty acid--CoA ligase [Marinitenerispora sediminis]RCV54517.1 long-chain fatty acid--CoA ligase [Marinitenerispora sediminis]RCV61381.1 long-chain fatty acid--CoA ligase [Marinitenerispora sediminis]
MTLHSVPALAVPPEHGGLAEPLFRVAETDPDRVLLARRAGDGWTGVRAADFRDEVCRVAAGLVAAGVAPGDRVAILADNRYEWTLADYAVWAAGAVTVPVYPSSSRAQVRTILADSGARGCFVDTADRARAVQALRPDLPGLRDTWTFDEGAVAGLAEAGAGVDRERLAERRATVRPGDPATLVYTSGTTGPPKGCVLTHANFFAEVDNIIAALPELFARDAAGRRPRTVLFLPLAHVFGRMVQVCAVHAGVELAHSASVRELLADLASFRPTFLLVVPYVLEKILDTARRRASGGVRGRVFEAARATAVAYSEALDTGGPGPLLRLRRRVFARLVYRRVLAALGGHANRVVSGGGALEPSTLHFFRGMGLEVIEGYGLTETTAAVAATRPGRIRPGTVGPPLPGAEIQVADDGEVLVRGAQTFTGYWNDEAATAAALRDGWFATGDLGAFDDEGNLRITGRKKEILVTTGGKNVVPGPLEDRVRRHPLVSNCMALGDGRPFVAALVTVDRQALRRWCDEHGKPADLDPATDPDLAAEIQRAVDEANDDVSRAESIRAFRVLPGDFGVDDETLTPTLKLRRATILERYAAEVERIYARK